MNEKPIYMQLMDRIEDQIISEQYMVGDLVISSTQMCKLYNVNPVTSMHALSALADGGILVKDRGIGMRVTAQAKTIILAKRKTTFLSSMLDSFLSEAKKLDFTEADLLALIREKYNKE